MEMESIGSQKLNIPRALVFATLLLATLLTGCYGPDYYGGGGGYYGGGGGGWWGGPSWWGGPGYVGSTNVYTRNVYRGYGGYDAGVNRTAFGAYAPAHDTWAASTRGRTSFGGGGVHTVTGGGTSFHGGGGHGGGGGGHGR